MSLRTPSPLVRFVGSLLILAVGIGVMAEVFMRMRYRARFGASWPLQTVREDPESGLYVPIPGEMTASIHIDSRGYRSPEIVVPKPPGTIRLAFLGASTTFCSEVSCDEATWPYLVWNEIQRRHPDAHVDFVNGAVSGYRLKEVEATVLHRLKAVAPDVIVINETLNDLTCDSRELAKEQGVYTGHDDPDHWLMRHSLAWQLVEKNVLVHLRQDSGMKSEGRLAMDAPRLAGAYEQKLEGTLRTCNALARLTAIATFSQQLRRDQTPEQQRAACVTHFYYMPYMSVDAILAGVDGYNGATRQAANATGTLVIDGENDVPGDAENFVDSVHLTDAGCRKMADRVVRALEASQKFQALFGPQNGR